jgi:hypothetical protein
MFYLHGKQTSYTISAKRYEYSGEEIATGDVGIDILDSETTATIDDSIRDFTEALEFDETDPFGDSW